MTKKELVLNIELEKDLSDQFQRFCEETGMSAEEVIVKVCQIIVERKDEIIQRRLLGKELNSIFNEFGDVFKDLSGK